MRNVMKRLAATFICGGVIVLNYHFPVFADGEEDVQSKTVQILGNESREFSVREAVNSAVLTPHDSYSLYNIKGSIPFRADTYFVTENDKRIIDEFAQAHFSEDMTNYDKIEYTLNWLNENVTYASGELYNEICADSWAEACFVKHKGQCLQYNGALAELLAYMGYDVYMLEMWLGDNANQHFRAEVNINGQAYSIEAGNAGQSGSDWKWMFLPVESCID